MSFPRAKPGLPISAAAHAGLLAATLIAFAQAPKFAETPETVPIEVVTDQQLNEIMKGEKTARAVKPAQRAEKVETHPHPPQAEAKRDIPTPPPSFKRVAEPNADDAPEKPVKEPPTPPKRVAALTPEPPTRPAPAPKPVPAPPVKPQVKPQVKAAPEPDDDKPDDAEVVKPKPPVKPKLEKVEKETPTPPKPTEKPKEAPRLKTDEVAKLLQQKKLDKTAEKAVDREEDKPKSAEPKSGKPKSGDESAPKSKFSAANIANLLSHEAPQQRASIGRERTQLASLGAPTATAARMSPSLQGRIDSYTVEHYRKCWATALSMNAMTYVPRVEFRLSPVGALEGEPRLLNPSSNPIEKARGEQALAAVRRCSPMQIPAEFTPYYDYWRVTELDMKEDM